MLFQNLGHLAPLARDLWIIRRTGDGDLELVLPIHRNGFGIRSQRGCEQATGCEYSLHHVQRARSPCFHRVRLFT